MSVATAISPAELVELDAPTFDALERANAERWDAATELAAGTFEVASAILATYLKVHSKKGARTPDPIRVPRPEWIAELPEPAPARDRVSVRALAALTGKRIEGVTDGR